MSFQIVLRTSISPEMTRKGPKIATRRDENNIERVAASCCRHRDEEKDAKTEEALKVFDSNSRPMMPELARDRRVLRAGLKARGVTLSRVCYRDNEPTEILPASEPFGMKARGQIRGIESNDNFVDT